MIDVETQVARVLAETRRLPVEEVPLELAHGRVLAEACSARLALPLWDNSAMDGYAVRAVDVELARDDAPVTLTVVADLPAGSADDPALLPGQAARIMTGAPVPRAADAIVPVEATDGGTRSVRIRVAAEPGAHIRRGGEDKHVGDPIVPAGVTASAEVLSALASAGYASVRVSRRPRLAVIATGSELVAPGAALRRGQIPDSNSLLIASLARDNGADVVAALRVSDEIADLEAAVLHVAPQADLIVLTGGVSMGAYDPVKELFSRAGQVAFSKVAMQPGKPQGFGRLAAPWVAQETLGPLVFGLPGNPVSAWVSFQVFVRPSLRTMRGQDSAQDSALAAVAGVPWRTPPGRRQYLAARITETATGRSVAPAAARGSGSHLVGSLAGANGYAIVDAAVERIEAGDIVRVVRLAPEHN